jgi:hypothetical protein
MPVVHVGALGFGDVCGRVDEEALLRDVGEVQGWDAGPVPVGDGFGDVRSDVASGHRVTLVAEVHHGGRYRVCCGG